MQFLVNLISGFVALLAAAALSHFGVGLNPPQKTEREVRRTADCPPAPASGAIAVAVGKDASRDC